MIIKDRLLTRQTKYKTDILLVLHNDAITGTNYILKNIKTGSTGYSTPRTQDVLTVDSGGVHCSSFWWEGKSLKGSLPARFVQGR